MTVAAIPIEVLMRRLAETPAVFMDTPQICRTGRVHVDAVVNDLLHRLGHQVKDSWLDNFQESTASADSNRLSVTLVLCWLLWDDHFAAARPPLTALKTLLLEEATALAEQVAAGKFIEDPDRREELARLALDRCGMRPAGESRAQARDRLASLNSRERARVLAAARAAEERARKIREQLARQAAAEAADKWTRE